MEMALECKRVLEHENGLSKVAFVLPRRPGRAARMRLAGSRSPLGEIACVNTRGHTVCHFDAIDVLAWLSTQGIMQIAIAEDLSEAGAK